MTDRTLVIVASMVGGLLIGAVSVVAVWVISADRGRSATVGSPAPPEVRITHCGMPEVTPSSSWGSSSVPEEPLITGTFTNTRDRPRKYSVVVLILNSADQVIGRAEWGSGVMPAVPSGATQGWQATIVEPLTTPIPAQPMRCKIAGFQSVDQ